MSIEAQEKRQGAVLAAPALLWTLVFFILPFGAMILISLAHMEGRTVVQGFDLGNYIKIFSDPPLRKLTFPICPVSREVTASLSGFPSIFWPRLVVGW